MSDAKGHTGPGPALQSSAGGEEADRPLKSRASPEDIRLITLLRQGDQQTFGKLVDRYHGRLLRLAQAFVKDSSTAEEVVQETWMVLVGGLDSFEGKSTLRTWLFHVLVNRAKTRAVRESRSVPFSALAPSDAEPAVEPSRFQQDGTWAEPPQRWDEETPERLLFRKESMALIHEAMAELPPNQRAVLTLRDVEELDSEEVCNVLQISESNQRVLLHRARSKVRRALEKLL